MERDNNNLPDLCYPSKMEHDNNMPDVLSENVECCVHCDLKFSSVDDLIEYSRIHENPWCCFHCDMSFTIVDSFRWHMQGSNDAPTNDTPEEGTEDEDMPELMLGGTPHCLFFDPRIYNADELMLVSSLRGNHSTQESGTS